MTPSKIFIDTFFTPPARGMWNVAVNLAGFDPDELWAEVCRRRRGRQGRINERTIDNAMGVVAARYAC